MRGTTTVGCDTGSGITDLPIVLEDVSFSARDVTILDRVWHASCTYGWIAHGADTAATAVVIFWFIASLFGAITAVMNADALPDEMPVRSLCPLDGLHGLRTDWSRCAAGLVAAYEQAAVVTLEAFGASQKRAA